jgi:ribonucleotide monophosphatase NagD (HAD superfamily)
MPHRSATSTDLRAALRGVRAFLLDMDGVTVKAGKPIPGATEAIEELDRRGMPYRIVTNTSAISRETLSRWSAKLGTPIPADRFESALSATAAWTARHFPGRPMYVLASEDAKREFSGQRLLSHDEASDPESDVAAVIVGDSPEEATYDNMNRAFRLVMRGALLIGMHRKRLVADSRRTDARLRRLRRRPRIRKPPARDGDRQAVRRLLRAGRPRSAQGSRPGPRPERHRDGRR